MTVDLTQRARGLRPDCLSFPEVLAQAIALIAPTATAALNAPLVFSNAGNATWLAYVLATTGIILVSLNINQFARHSASTGALYVYVARGLGSTTGIICGWALTLAYLCCCGAVVAAFAHYANIVLAEFEVQMPVIVLYAICVGIAWYYAYTDIQLSAVLMLVIELIVLGFILFLAFLILAQQGFSLDVEQLQLTNATPNGVSLGMVIAILSFVGFESTTTLGNEAKSPKRTIPKALIWSALISGLFFILISYVEVLGFRGSEIPLNESSAPLNVLSKSVGLELLGLGLDAGIAFSFFSCALASLNAGARIAYALARHSFFPTRLGEAHQQNETPHVAVSICVVVTFVIVASMGLFGIKDVEIYSYLGTISSYGVLCAYLLVSIAAPVYLAQQGRLQQRHLVISLLAGFFMLIPIAGSFYPVPDFPFNIFPYLFLLYLAVGGGWFMALRNRSPQIAENLKRDTE